MVSLENLSKRKLMHFYTNLCLTKKKIDEKRIAQTKLNEQIEKVKGIYTEPKLSVAEIEREFMELKNYIAEFIEKEKGLMTARQRRFITKDEFRAKLLELEKRVDTFLHQKNKGNKRIEELDNKVKTTVSNRERKIKELKSRIKRLEGYYKALKMDKHNKSAMEIIKGRIAYLKREIREIS